MSKLVVLLLISCFSLAFCGCMKTEIINQVILEEQNDTVPKKVKELNIQIDTTDIIVPITFNPSVKDWEEQEVNN